MAEDQGPSLEGDLSRSPTKPEAATGKQGGHKNESWRQPEGEKDITKFRFPVKGDGSLLEYSIDASSNTKLADRPKVLAKGTGVRSRRHPQDSSRDHSEMALDQADKIPDGNDNNDHTPPTNTQPVQPNEDVSRWQPTTSLERSAWKQLNKDWHRSIKDWYESPGHPGCYNPIFDDMWTASDELNLRSRECDLVSMNVLDYLNADDTQDLCTLFDTSLRLFRTDPLTLFSIQNLEFDNQGPATINQDGMSASSLVWASDFSRKLSVIMANPMWKGTKSYSFMLFAIKWVVICRTDDRHPLPQSDIDLLRWADIILDPSANNKPFGIRHQEHQCDILKQGGWSTPEAELLSAIWRMTGASARLARVATHPYLISAADLTILTDALDSLGQGGMIISCETHYQIFLGARAGPVYPSGIAELKTLHRNCWLSVQRVKARRERQESSLNGDGTLQNHSLSRRDPGLGDEGGEEGTRTGLSVNDGTTSKIHPLSPLIDSADTNTQDTDTPPSRHLPSDGAQIPNIGPPYFHDIEPIVPRPGDSTGMVVQQLNMESTATLCDLGAELKESESLEVLARILELTKRLDKLRPGGDDIAVASGYTAKMVKKIKETNACAVLLHKQCDDEVERLRENLADADALFKAKGMASWIGAINPNEEEASCHRPPSQLWRRLPPQLAQPLENAEFSVPNSQPMSNVLRLAENVPRLREENAALREQVEELHLELKARDDLRASSKEALEQQKADFDNTEFNQVDAKAGQLEAALARAQFSLKKVKEECNSQEEELRKMAKSQAHYKS
ncbi:hypothetical protein CEP52_012548, partial [Fusarium oligoseptatum]